MKHQNIRINALYGSLILLVAMLLTTACGVPAPETPIAEDTSVRLQKLLEKAFAEFGDSEQIETFVQRLRPPKRPWHSMTRSQKRRHMDQYVMPVMQAFYAYYLKPRLKILGYNNPFERKTAGVTVVDGYRTVGRLPATLDCQTCHGGGPIDQFEPDFSKPTTLHPLDPKKMPTRHDSDPFIAETVKYMEDVVVPAMQIMLDRPSFDCFGCHAVKK